MTFFDWMDLASSLARLSALIGSCVISCKAIRNWANGNKTDAIWWLGMAIFLLQLSRGQ